MTYDDSDAATELPPLDQADRDSGMLVTSYDLTQEGIIAHPEGETAVVFLSVRGLARDERGGSGWVQTHIGIPRAMVGDVWEALGMYL